MDRVTVSKDERGRLADSLETALNLGDETAVAWNVDANKEILLSQKFACPDGHVSVPELAPRNFSFNSPHGACPDCTGLGTKLEIVPELVIPNPRLSLAEGAIRPWSKTTSRISWYTRVLAAVAAEYGFSMNTPVKDLPKKVMDVVMNGTGGKKVHVLSAGNTARAIAADSDEETEDDTEEFESYGYEGDTTFEGVIPNLERRYHATDSDFVRHEIEGYMRITECPTCAGKRLKPEILAVTVGGKSIHDVSSLGIDDAAGFFAGLAKQLSDKDKKIAYQILREILARLTFLMNVGLNYLTLNRSADTLSGGEAQRIRLATQIGSGLTGVLYILDEPSIGLHQRDNDRLLATLRALRDLGNTVIVVEHDEDTILAADWVVDIGPGAGKHGGEIIAEGTPAQIKKNKNSITGKFLSGAETIDIPKRRRAGNGKLLQVIGATANNLKDINVDFPLGKFVCLTGVSGSGKSTLLNDILAKQLAKQFFGAKDEPGEHKRIMGVGNIDKVISIDQSPIGRTPRSNPATYTGVFTTIRDLFAATPEAKVRGYRSGRFSFNVKGGRCETCGGDGVIKIEMNFLPDVYVACEECKGRRYNREALEIHYKGKNISEVLEMTVDEAAAFFKNLPAIYKKLQTLSEVGLGYMHLGQQATTLSGGEAQRIKLAAELSRTSTGRTLYILDEPTTGLHFADVKRLLAVLARLVDKGNTVVVIEHNLDVIAHADWIVDLGPEGGNKGGQIVAAGTPEDVAKVKASYTGQFLKRHLAKAK